MSMESTHRSLDRSREPGPKKPRLIEELNARQLPQRQQVSGAVTTLASTRHRTDDRDSEGGGGYQPQPPPHLELLRQYKTALAELTFNSKPIITNLTIIAGENLSAAKAIAATVCANILEVPSDQKLPSLYLLDSIVKNIGRDYIKYFAARLPEVFCKAYRQVDPCVHSSMKHLFGTWKGVFPPQCLQMIEKELGFAPAVNGSASVSATVRSDLQSQRPPHSIHVNPKYLERQRLQQSSGSKRVVNDMTGSVLNSNEDAERPPRALGSARPCLDPRINMINNQHAHRDAFNDSVPEKSIDGSYGGNGYGAGLSNRLISGAGRTGTKIIDSGHVKTWFKTDGGDAETISGQRNGFSLKRSFLNHEAPKSMNLDAHHQLRQNITNIWSNVMSGNWKNSEEELTWDDMNSGLNDLGPNVSNNMNIDSLMADDEKLEREDHLQITRPFEAKVDREISTVQKQLPGFGGNRPSSWQMQKHHSIDKLKLKPGCSEGFVSPLISLPTNTSSLAVKKGDHSFMPNAVVEMAKIVGQQFDYGETESPSGPTLLQQSPSLSGTVHHPHSMQNLDDQEMPHNLKTSHFLVGPKSQDIRDCSPTVRPLVQVGNLRRSQEKDMQGSLSSSTSFGPKLQQQLLDPSQTDVTAKTKLPQSKVPLARETSEKLTTNNLSAATVKSGIIHKRSITSNLDPRKLPSLSGVQPPRSGWSSPTKLVSSSLDSLHNDSSTLPKKPQGKGRQPPEGLSSKPTEGLSTQPSTSSNVSSSSAASLNATNNNKLNPIANLLSSLVAKGLISAETESPTMVPSVVPIGFKDQTEIVPTSCPLPVTSVSGSAAVPVSSSRDEVDSATKTSLTSPKSTSMEIKNLIGFDFRPNVIREFHPHVVRDFLDNFPHQCKICGIRLKQEEQYSRHLEWHAAREHGLSKTSRSWYVNSSDWIAGKAECLSEFEFIDSVDILNKEASSSQLDTMVLADENQCLCVLCGELFDDVYCHARNEWMFKGAVYMNYSDIKGDMESRNLGPIIHAKCLSENSIVKNLVRHIK